MSQCAYSVPTETSRQPIQWQHEVLVNANAFRNWTLDVCVVILDLAAFVQEEDVF